MCSISVELADGTFVSPSYADYVPGFFPGDHAGDYLELDIDVATGTIKNWPKGLTDRKICKDMNIPFPLSSSQRPKGTTGAG